MEVGKWKRDVGKAHKDVYTFPASNKFASTIVYYYYKLSM